MADTFAKKELQKKRAKKKEDKAQKREERKTNNNKGKSLEEMTVYLDEYGNITDIPPDKQQIRKKINANDIQLGPTRNAETKEECTGTIALFFSDKCYGFITEDKTRASIFVHSNKLLENIKEKDRVVYEKERTPKGFSAINVRKIK